MAFFFTGAVEDVAVRTLRRETKAGLRNGRGASAKDSLSARVCAAYQNPSMLYGSRSTHDALWLAWDGRGRVGYSWPADLVDRCFRPEHVSTELPLTHASDCYGLGAHILVRVVSSLAEWTSQKDEGADDNGQTTANRKRFQQVEVDFNKGFLRSAQYLCLAALSIISISFRHHVALQRHQV